MTAMSARTGPLAEILPWDTDFFGIRIARLAVPHLARDDAESLRSWARAERVACVYALIDAGDVQTSQVMADLGAGVADIRLTMAADPLESSAIPAPDLPLREATEADLPTLEEIAATSHRDSRFYADARFPRPRVDELYRVWLRNALRGGDRVVTFDHEGRAAGYVTCAISARGSGASTGRIGLVAVAKEARGRGVGSALLAAVMSDLARAGAATVQVVTQGRNVAAQRAYQRRGFRTERVEHWYHLWLDETPS
jgi:dTDP-4-amino-4,6-dideoxy-D-galactose acyltransferase